jgi:hypothetical protein
MKCATTRDTQHTTHNTHTGCPNSSSTHFVQGRACDEDMTVRYELPLVSVEKGEQEEPYVRSIHVCVRHDDDAMVPETLDVKLDA